MKFLCIFTTHHVHMFGLVTKHLEIIFLNNVPFY